MDTCLPRRLHNRFEIAIRLIHTVFRLEEIALEILLKPLFMRHKNLGTRRAFLKHFLRHVGQFSYTKRDIGLQCIGKKEIILRDIGN